VTEVLTVEILRRSSRLQGYTLDLTLQVGLMRVIIEVDLRLLSRVQDQAVDLLHHLHDRQHHRLEGHLDLVVRGRLPRAGHLGHTGLHLRSGAHRAQGVRLDQALRGQAVQVGRLAHSEVVAHLVGVAPLGAHRRGHLVHVHLLRDQVLLLGEEVSRITLGKCLS